MNETNRLGLRVVGITAAIFLLVLMSVWGVRWTWQSLRAPEEREALTTPTVDTQVAADQDGDGLPDSFEEHYSTDPGVADTDGDGVADLLELNSGSNPTLAGPEDAVVPKTGEAVLDTSTFTGKYLAQLPDGLGREEILDQARLEAFVNEYTDSVHAELPTFTPTTTPVTDRDTVVAYLGAIAASHNESLRPVTNATIADALQAALANNPAALQQVRQDLEHNIAALRAVTVPEELAGLHTELVTSTQKLLANVRLLETIQTDFVGGLIATKNIEILGATFQTIAEEIQDLEAQYGIE